MEKVICLYKPMGKTPLETIQLFREKNPLYTNEKLGYAGRLDPMAEGLLLILVGEENKKRKEYERLSKTYEFEVLFGLTTDSYDVLGLITQEFCRPPQSLNKDISSVLKGFIGKSMQPYPPYSSPRVSGKSLFWWAREEKLHEITIPTKKIEIYNLAYIDIRIMDKKTLQKTILSRVGSVHGEFRQHEILSSWKKFFLNMQQDEFSLIRFSISCSSGVYVRSIAHALGQKIGCGALCFAIIRTHIEDYNLSCAKRL